MRVAFMQKYDVIVIGSGAAGLSAALRLSRQGRGVLVLEAAAEFGGYLNPFRRKGFLFDIGMHYVGGAAPGHPFHDTLEQLGLLDEISFAQLPADGFERFVFPELEFRMPSHREALRERLLEYFPQQQAGIHAYMDLLRITKPRDGRPRNLFEIVFEASMMTSYPGLKQIMNMTYGDLLHELFGEHRLVRAVLAGAIGNLGLPPSRASALMMLGFMNHVVDGAYFPRGGGGAFKNAFLRGLEAHGARLERRSPVARILTANNRVQGVRLEDGTEFAADVVVGAIDPAELFTRLAPPEEQTFRARAEQLEPSLSCVCFFAGVRVPGAQPAFDAENIWHYPSSDLDAMYSWPAHRDIFRDEFCFYLTSPSRKAPDTGLCPPGTETIQAIAYAPYEPFARWAHQPAMRRAADYREQKDLLRNRFAAVIEENYCKGLSANTEVEEFSTPVTNIHFTRARAGGMYGPAHTPAQMFGGRFKERGPWENFYLCGSGTTSAGVAPCCANGLAAAQAILRDQA